uniref:Peptidase M50 domain-containing protein n=1 Tax=Dunaliella tertiolecta TaxID=3047 RepID=A0A7S3VJN8_DUNTE
MTSTSQHFSARQNGPSKPTRAMVFVICLFGAIVLFWEGRLNSKFQTLSAEANDIREKLAALESRAKTERTLNVQVPSSTDVEKDGAASLGETQGTKYEEVMQSILQRLDGCESTSRALRAQSQTHLNQLQQAVSLINNHGKLLGGLQAQMNRQESVHSSAAQQLPQVQGQDTRAGDPGAAAATAAAAAGAAQGVGGASGANMQQSGGAQQQQLPEQQQLPQQQQLPEQQEQQQQQQQQQEKPNTNSSSTYKTLSTLDMLLGIDEEEERKKKQQEEEAKQQASAASTTDSSISPQAMQKLADADAQRFGGQGVPRDDVDGQFQKIIEKAKKLADNQASEADQAQLKQEFDGLLQKISKPPEAMSKEDIKRLKDAAFGPQTFWVTETQPITDLERSGLLIRGNLRDERTKVYEFVCQKVDELFDGKYTVLLVEDTLATEEDMVNGRIDTSSPTSSLNNPRVAFNIVPAPQAVPPQTTGWGSAVAFVLALLLVGSCGQLALAANVTKLPKETLEWFANPANLDTDALPPGLENWDPSEYFKSALPIFMAILGINVSHEIGHRLAALKEGVRLGPTYFIPNFQIGSFGAITPFISMLKNRTSMWEVSSAGPLTGAAVSALLLGAGLWQSHGVDANAVNDLMVPVPTTLFQGSLLLGSITRAVLGDQALRGTTVLVSPLVIAGWCGLVTQALQLLPVGNVDGGRMVQVRVCVLSVVSTVALACGKCRWRAHGAVRIWAASAVAQQLLHICRTGAGAAGVVLGLALWSVRHHLPEER